MRRLILLVVLTAACAGRYGYSTTDPVRRWSATRAAAESLATAGRYAAADSVLAEFSAAHAGTSESADALYLEALLSLDPSNLSANPQQALSALDAYERAPNNDAHLTEAHILRRVAVLVGSIQRLAEQAATQSDSASAADSAAKSAQQAAGDSRVRSKDEEIARLRAELESTRAELDKTKEELDRIKKRLAAPPRSDTVPPQ
jgi:uncharacterized small protein (DUF1192 family)